MSDFDYYSHRSFSVESLPAPQKEKLMDFLSSKSARPGDLEKLLGYSDLYSLRLSQKARLLFTFHQGSPLLLEYLPNHEYHKSWVLRSPRWRCDAFEEAVGEMIFTETDLAELKETWTSEPSKAQLSFAKVNYFRIPFVLSEAQEEAYHKTFLKPPAVINGVAGSGKTCLMMSILEQYAIAYRANPEEFKRVLYVCQSKPLAEEIRRIFIDQFGEDACHAVEITHYDALIEKEGYEPCLGFKEFATWFQERYLPALKQRQKVSSNRTIVQNTELLYQEFRMISGLSDAKDYLGLGARQSLFSDPEERDMVLGAYQSYSEHLHEQQERYRQVDPAFYAFRIDGEYDLVLADEGQDFSGMQSLILYLLSLGRILFGLDTRQSIADNMSKRPIYDWLAQKHGHRVDYVRLTRTFRCPELVARLANCVIGYKHRLTGGASDKDECGEVVSDESKGLGQAHLFVSQKPRSAKFEGWWSKQLEGNDAYRQLRDTDSTDIAIIISDESLRDEARKRFKTELVFTPEQIKGLEYKHIVLYRMLNDEYFSKASNHLKANPNAGSSNRAKQNKAHPEYGTELNKYVVALTRATEAVYIFDQKKRCNEEFVDTMNRSIRIEEVGEVSAIAPETNRPQHSDEQDWWQEVERLMRNGNEVQARLILENRLGMTEEATAAYCEKYHLPAEPIHKAAQFEANEGGSTNVSCSGNPSERLSPEIKRRRPYRSSETVLQMKDWEKIDWQKMTNKLLCECLMDEAFIHWIQMNPKYLVGGPQALWQAYEFTNRNTESRASVLFNLVYDDEGMNCLEGWLKYNKYDLEKIIQNLPKGAWREPIYGKIFDRHEESLTSPLANLTEAKKGFSWLSRLIDSGISVLEDLDLEDIVFQSVQPYGLVTPLFWMARFTPAVGGCVFSQFLQQNPDLLAKIPHEEWFRKCIVNCGQGITEAMNTSAFYWLCASVNQEESILEELLFGEDLHLARSIPAEFWEQYPEDKDRPYASPLYWLCSCEKGRDILSRLARSYPEVVSKISEKSWLAESQEDDSPIDVLTHHANDIRNFKTLFPFLAEMRYFRFSINLYANQHKEALIDRFCTVWAQETLSLQEAIYWWAGYVALREADDCPLLCEILEAHVKPNILRYLESAQHTGESILKLIKAQPLIARILSQHPDTLMLMSPMVWMPISEQSSLLGWFLVGENKRFLSNVLEIPQYKDQIPIDAWAFEIICADDDEARFDIFELATRRGLGEVVALIKNTMTCDYDVVAKKNNKPPLLCWAAVLGYVDIARILLEAGFDPNVEDVTTGLRPILYAARYNYLEIIALLDAYNADLNIGSKPERLTVLSMVLCPDVPPQQRLEVLRLLDNKIDFSETMPCGRMTPLCYALLKAQTETVRFLATQPSVDFGKPITAKVEGLAVHFNNSLGEVLGQEANKRLQRFLEQMHPVEQPTQISITPKKYLEIQRNYSLLRILQHVEERDRLVTFIVDLIRDILQVNDSNLEKKHERRLELSSDEKAFLIDASEQLATSEHCSSAVLHVYYRNNKTVIGEWLEHYDLKEGYTPNLLKQVLKLIVHCENKYWNYFNQQTCTETQRDLLEIISFQYFEDLKRVQKLTTEITHQLKNFVAKSCNSLQALPFFQDNLMDSFLAKKILGKLNCQKKGHSYLIRLLFNQTFIDVAEDLISLEAEKKGIDRLPHRSEAFDSFAEDALRELQQLDEHLKNKIRHKNQKTGEGNSSNPEDQIIEGLFQTPGYMETLNGEGFLRCLKTPHILNYLKRNPNVLSHLTAKIWMPDENGMTALHYMLICEKNVYDECLFFDWMFSSPGVVEKIPMETWLNAYQTIVKNTDRWKIFVLAAIYGLDDVMELLRDAPFEPDFYAKAKHPLLSLAVQNGHYNTLKKLLDLNRFDVNFQGDKEMTALHHAAKMDHVEMIEMLAQSGANLDIQDELGQTPAYLAANLGCINALEALGNLQADLNREDFYGSTPLIEVILNGLIRPFETLVNCPTVDLEKPWVDSKENMIELIMDAEYENIKNREGGDCVLREKVEAFLNEKIKNGMPEDEMSLSPSELTELLEDDEMLSLLEASIEQRRESSFQVGSSSL